MKNKKRRLALLKTPHILSRMPFTFFKVYSHPKHLLNSLTPFLSLFRMFILSRAFYGATFIHPLSFFLSASFVKRRRRRRSCSFSSLRKTPMHHRLREQQAHPVPCYCKPHLSPFISIVAHIWLATLSLSLTHSRGIPSKISVQSFSINKPYSSSRLIIEWYNYVQNSHCSWLTCVQILPREILLSLIPWSQSDSIESVCACVVVCGGLGSFSQACKSERANKPSKWKIGKADWRQAGRQAQASKAKGIFCCEVLKY